MDLKYWISNTAIEIRNFFKFNVIGRIRHGFDIRDTWNLDSSIGRYIVPRLKFFIINKPAGHPSLLDDADFVAKHNLKQYVGDGEDNYAAWIIILNKILVAFSFIAVEDNINRTSSDVEEGLRLFAIFCTSLWD